jgi:class 3 adenylate cyclase
MVFVIDIINMIRGFRTVTGEEIQVRVGLASGAVTGGILGDANPHWCIVGDTVTIASKMEASSKKMEIHMAETTYNLLKATGKYSMTEAEPLNLKV